MNFVKSVIELAGVGRECLLGEVRLAERWVIPGSGIKKIGGALWAVAGTRSEPDWQGSDPIIPPSRAASSGSGRISRGPQPVWLPCNSFQKSE